MATPDRFRVTRAARFHLVGHDWGGAVAWAELAELLLEHLAVASTRSLTGG